MNRTLPICFVLALLCAAGVRPTQAEERLGSKPREGLLLLKNGETLSGNIALIGDQYYIVQEGAEFRVKTGDAQFYCRDLDDAYERQKSQIGSGKVADHVALAEWCLRKNLNGYAAAQLNEALTLEPRHPRLPLLERRLRLAMSGPAVETEPSQVSVAPSHEDLDQMVRSLPPGAVETFTTTVQPLLLNNCATSGCHGLNAKDEFRLGKSSSGHPLTRRLTQRNLAATLKLLDREQPDQSPLLLMARQAHGTVKSAPLADRDTGPLRQLQYWIDRVAAQPAPAATAKLADSRPLLQVRESISTPQQPADEPGPSTAEQDPDQSDEEPDVSSPEHGDDRSATTEPESEDETGKARAATSEENEDSPSAPRQRGRARKPVQRGRAIESFTPVDPFDPEIFNRRYAPAAKE